MNKNHESHSQKETRRFECLKCDKSFLYKIAYNKHIEKHEKLLTKVDSDNEKIEQS